MVTRTFALPDLGEGLEEAVVDAWLVGVGDAVALNQPIAEIETAKATVEVPSPFAGRVAQLHAVAGATLRVGEALVTIEVQDETVEADPPADDAPADDAPTGAGVRRPATPAVRALARERGVDLASIAGSGPEGRVTREDVERAAAPFNAGRPDAEEIEVTAVRRTAASRLTASAAVPTVTTWRTLDCTALERVRAEAGLSPLPYVVRALAETCRRHPAINASWADRTILVHRRVNVGIATDTERGLLVPVVRDADRLRVAEIADRVAGLAASARDGSISPEDLAGHTITVTNTGSYGSESGTPLLHLPDAVIVGFGVIEPRALVVDGAVGARPACTLSVTFDHRVLDGAAVGRALDDLVAILRDEGELRTVGG